jgi:hypothetical protein
MKEYSSHMHTCMELYVSMQVHMYVLIAITTVYILELL